MLFKALFSSVLDVGSRLVALGMSDCICSHTPNVFHLSNNNLVNGPITCQAKWAVSLQGRSFPCLSFH